MGHLEEAGQHDQGIGHEEVHRDPQQEEPQLEHQAQTLILYIPNQWHCVKGLCLFLRRAFEGLSF